MPQAARADLYSAAEAAEAKDFARAFELYRELAELGHAESQEMIAAMYVNGEGVKRDNVLGYAWPCFARRMAGRDRKEHRQPTRTAYECGRAGPNRRGARAIRRGALQSVCFPRRPRPSGFRCLSEPAR
jgi:hypothetical protein